MLKNQHLIVTHKDTTRRKIVSMNVIYIYIILVLSSSASTPSTRTECGGKAAKVFNSQQYQMSSRDFQALVMGC
jgi:uncharacterized membrane protein